jgi:regulatory protein
MTTMKKENYTEALLYAAHLCSVSEQCKVDVEEKLRRFELEPEEAHRLIEQLEEDGYLDERRYTNAYVNDKFQLNKWGRVKIKSYLKQKKITNEIIDEVLSGLNEALYTKTLMDLFRRKDRSIHGSNSLERRAKLYRFALGRGFELSMVNSCLREYLNDSDEPFEA